MPEALSLRVVTRARLGRLVFLAQARRKQKPEPPGAELGSLTLTLGKALRWGRGGGCGAAGAAALFTRTCRAGRE